MSEMTIITAFWDIGRKDFNLFPRSNEKYLEHFKFWARIKNNLVIYTYKDMIPKIKKIREDFGLLDKTTIIEINDETEIEKSIYNKMVDVSKNPALNDYRYTKNVVENNAKYNYVMMLKFWCMADAVKRNLTGDMVAWLDFGYNHGDDCFTKSEEFDFKWCTKLETNKIHLFALNEPDSTPVFELVRNMNINLMGAPVIASSNLCEKLWDLVKKQMESLTRVGFIDDDQLLLLMSYREEPDIFKIHKSYWFMPLKENGGEHLTIKEEFLKKEEIDSKKTLKSRIYLMRRYLGYLKHEKKYFK